MAVPKKKTSKSKRNMRRSHHALSKVNVVVDSVTGEYKLPHHISLADGYYNGVQVVQGRRQQDDQQSDDEAA
jgi:large subunit ribosomal protein L32